MTSKEIINIHIQKEIEEIKKLDIELKKLLEKRY